MFKLTNIINEKKTINKNVTKFIYCLVFSLVIIIYQLNVKNKKIKLSTMLQMIIFNF